ncbi:MBL fold metallo-hydrolase [Bradyrhizobium sp.]|uniref:MBL fold metallo-hydrolase n=1 Tax=Bradyrhizobium sp. TaxID=376 RepID=UPI000B2DD26F|nr:MBL fold metallo-hydrolase [Bradyrhizobium sp.]
MPIHICSACGTSYPDAAEPPRRCPICEDERQFVPSRGQTWTTPQSLGGGHVNAWRQLETGLFEIHTHPQFAIGQRALLLRTDDGNILWDCIALLDDASGALIDSLGGLRAIAISHPHYYTCMQDWARRFDCPIHLHAADSEWIMRPDPAIRHWHAETMAIADGVTLLRIGGHFAGGTVLHWAGGAGGRGAILSGDIVQVAADPGRVSFLWSYPNMMPLSAMTVRRIADTLAPWKFDRIYGAFPGRQVMSGGATALERSATRYIELLKGDQA